MEACVVGLVWGLASCVVCGVLLSDGIFDLAEVMSGIHRLDRAIGLVVPVGGLRGIGWRCGSSLVGIGVQCAGSGYVRFWSCAPWHGAISRPVHCDERCGSTCIESCVSAGVSEWWWRSRFAWHWVRHCEEGRDSGGGRQRYCVAVSVDWWGCGHVTPVVSRWDSKVGRLDGLLVERYV